MNENVKIFFGLIGGLALFLYGMNSMSDALQKAAGEGMKKILSFLTRNAVIGSSGRSIGNCSFTEQLRHHCHGDRICQCWPDESSSGHFRYFRCQYRYDHDGPADGI